MILVLCLTTLRLRELLNRRWAEVHLDGPALHISVPHTKTGVPRKAPLPRVAVEALKALPVHLERALRLLLGHGFIRVRRMGWAPTTRRCRHHLTNSFV